MRTIPNILDYENTLDKFHSPKEAHAHRISKTSGTKVHVIRDLQKRVKNSSKRRKFGIVQDRLRDMLIASGV